MTRENEHRGLKTDLRQQTALTLASPKPLELIRELIDRYTEQGLETRVQEQEAVVEFPNSRLLLTVANGEVQALIDALNESQLYWVREGLSQELARFPDALLSDLRWISSAPAEGQHPENFRLGTVISRKVIFDGLIRIEAALDRPLGPGGFHFKMLLPPDGKVRPEWPRLRANGSTDWPEGEHALHRRTYTVRAERDNGYTIDIDIVRHDGGRTSDWSWTVKPGQLFGVLGPSGIDAELFEGDDNETISKGIIAGDMTALPAIARILESKPADDFQVWAACSSQKDADRYFGYGRVNAVSPRSFDKEIIGILSAQARPSRAWFAGEFETAQAVRKLLKDKWGLEKRNQLSVAYWRRDTSTAAKN